MRRTRHILLTMGCVAVAATSMLRANEPATPEPSLKPTSVAQLLEQLDSTDWVLQAEAIAQLVKRDPKLAARSFGPIALDEQRSPWFRGEALRGLSIVDAGAAIEIARPLLGDRAEPLCIAAVDVVGQHGERGDVSNLTTLLDDQRREVRRAALLALARRAPKAAWQHAEQSVADDTSSVDVTHAAEALAIIGTDEARARLRALLQHRREPVRVAAVQAIAMFKDASAAETLFGVVARSPQWIDPVDKAATEAMTRVFGEKADAMLIERLSSNDAPVRQAALHLIAARPTQPLCDAMAKRLTRLADIDADAAVKAMGILAAADGNRYEPQFTAMLGHASPAVQRGAIEQVSALANVNLFKALSTVMNKGDSAVREAVLAAVESRGDLPDRGLATFLSPAIDSNQPELRGRAMALLAKHMRPAEFTDALGALDPLLAGTDERDKYAAAKLLLESAPRERRHEVIAALGYIARWQVIGSFENDKRNLGLARRFPPEKEVDFDAELEGVDGTKIKWSAWSVDRLDGRVELHRIMPVPVHYRIAYGYAEVNVAADTLATVTVECDESFVLFVNGQSAMEAGRRGVYRQTLKLEKGTNRLLIKVSNLRDWWYYSVRVTDAKGNRLIAPSNQAPRFDQPADD